MRIRVKGAYPDVHDGSRPTTFYSCERSFVDDAPAVGDTVMLPDGSEHGQDVTVTDRVWTLDGRLEIWVGGWTGWPEESVAKLFDSGRPAPVR